MKKLLMLALAATTTFGVATVADARQGCGPGGHRGPAGYCRPNMRGGPGYNRGPRVAGRYYNGQGYWNNGRYWQNRYRYNNGWRYR